MKMLVAVLSLLAACDQQPLTATTPVTPARPVTSGRPVDTHMTLATFSLDVTFPAGGRDIPGTITTPKDEGPWPAVVLMAGSGPTDRNWNSPLLKAQNGSGRLLAEALSKHGMVVLRFDKAGTGKNPGPPLDQFTLDTYRDEGLGAIAYLRTRLDVRKDRIFVAGHSEGGIHATRTALVPTADVTGVIYLSAAGRTMSDIMLGQLEGNLRNPLAGMSEAQIKAEMGTLRAAFSDFIADRPVDPLKASTLPVLQQLVASIMAPATVKLTRALFSYDTAAEAPKLTVPVFIFNGGKDVQIDPELDARHLEHAFVQAHREVTFHLSPDADHVLKHEPRDAKDVRADLLATQNGYNTEGRVIDDDLATALVKWIADRAK